MKRDTEYLKAALLAYFPQNEILVDHDDELEAINIAVYAGDVIVAGYTCEIGSDDDMYVFTPNSPWSDTRHPITVPLMGEEA